MKGMSSTLQEIIFKGPIQWNGSLFDIMKDSDREAIGSATHTEDEASRNKEFV